MTDRSGSFIRAAADGPRSLEIITNDVPSSSTRIEPVETVTPQCFSKLCYDMRHKNRGIAMIFNHRKFESFMGLKERFGTDQDRDRLAKSLSGIGFEVLIFNDLKYEQVLKELEKGEKKT